MTSLSRNGYSIKKNSIDEKELQKIRDDLTVCVENRMFDNVPPKRYSLYRENDTKIYLPKFYGLQKFGLPKRNVIGTGIKCPRMIFNGDLRPVQMEQVNAYMSALHDPQKMGGIISIKCGGGKSVIAIYIACLLKLKTLFIVHKEFLGTQFAERISMFSPTSKIGILKQNKIDIEDKDFVVASLQSIAMKDYPQEIFDQFGLVIIDEIHRTSAEVFSQALIKACCPYALGLSATLNRKDGLRKVFEWFVGKPVIKPTSKDDDSNVLIKCCTFNCNDLDYCQTLTMYNNKINAVGMLSQAANYIPRAEYIVDVIMNNMDEQRKVIVLSERKGLLETLHKMLTKICKDQYTVAFYVGGMKQSDLDISATKDIILGTYQLAQEGLDIPSLNMLVMATGIGDIQQSVGRILRDKPEDRKVIPIVIDIVDNFSIFKARYEKRLSYYKKKDYTIEYESSLTKEEKKEEKDLLKKIAQCEMIVNNVD